MAESVIVDVTLNQETAIKQNAELERQIIATKKSIDDLTSATAGNTGAQKASAESLVKLREELKTLKTEQSAVSKEIQTTNKSLSANEGSIAKNRAELSRLTAEYIKLSKPTKEQTAEINNLSKRLKEQEAAIGNTTRNVGNYNQAVQLGVNQLKQFVPGLGAVTSGLSAAQSVFKSKTVATIADTAATGLATASTVAFGVALGVATGGLTLIVAAIASLVTFLTRTERGMDIVKIATDALSTVFAVLVDRVSEFGEGVALILSGKFSAGADKLKSSFQGIGTEIKNEVKQSVELTKALDAVDDAEIELIATRAKKEKQISELRLAAKDETLTLDARKKSLQEAIALEESILDQELNIAKERARISQERLDAGESLEEDRKANAEAQALVDQLETAANDKKRALLKELSGLGKKDAAETKKDSEDQIKLDEKNAATRLQLSASLKQSEEEQLKVIEAKAEKFREAGASEVDIAAFVTEEKKKLAEQQSKDFTDNLNKRLTSLDTANQIEIAKVREKFAIQEAEAQGNSVRLQEIEIEKQAAISEITQTSLQEQIQTINEILNPAEVSAEEGAANPLSLADKILSPADKERLLVDLAELQAKLAEGTASIAQQDQESKDKQIEADDKLRDVKIGNAQSTVSQLGTMFKKGTALAKAAFLAEKAIALAGTIINTYKAVSGALANPPEPPFSIPQAIAAGVMGGIQAAGIIATTVSGFALGGIAKARKYAFGGLAFEGGHIPANGGMITGRPHGQGGVRFSMGNNIGEADGRKGEAYIINTKHDPFIKAAASSLNVMGGGHAFDYGGVVKYQDGGLSSNIGAPVFNSIDIGNQVVEGIANMPPVIVTVEDINAGLGRVASIRERASV